MEQQNNNVKFSSIDIHTWERAQLFHYFSKMAPTGYSITTELDISVMLSALKANKIKFFPAYLWITTKVINQLKAFKVAYREDVLGIWDELIPMYPHFHEEDKSISILWAPFNDDFQIFYQTYLNNQKKYGAQKTLLPIGQMMPPENCYSISCIPWLEFKHFALHSYENKPYFFPTIEAGKYFEREGRVMLPFSINVHHATVDGWHVSHLIELLQNEMNKIDIWN